MPRSKRLSLVFLLIMALSLPIMAAPAMSSPPPFSNDWGVVPEKSYPGIQVQSILDAVADEAGVAIADAFDQGYKTALLEVAPDRDYWKNLAESLAKKTDDLHPQIFLTGVTVGGAAVGLVAIAIAVLGR